MKARLFYTAATCILLVMNVAAQNTKPPFSVSGIFGFTYEGYGLNMNPSTGGFYSARKPWNQFRFIFAPTLVYKSFSLPVNFNFSAIARNAAGPYAALSHQNFGQFLTNPANNFALNPKYKWAELQLGTQYLNYSEFTTGDVGIFGVGFNLNPKSWRFKFFTGTSQQAVNYVAVPLPGVTGAYKRNHWMLQIGNEKEGKYKIAFNFSKGKDKVSSVTVPPITVQPQEGFAASIVADVFLKKGWYLKSEIAQSCFTKDLTQPLSSSLNNSFKPFITGRTSTSKDEAAYASIGKQSKGFNISYTTKYIGTGYQTTGYPYLQPDRWENTINTRFNAWKNKMNVVASIGERINNLSNTSLTNKQFICNLNWFAQFSEKFNTNISYNNFGFTAASGTNPFGIKNVSNDIGLSMNYNWKNSKRMNMLTFNYNFSKYDERDVITGIISSNNTHTILLSYMPVYFNSTLSPEFSVLYFNNTMPLAKTSLLTLNSGLSAAAFKKKAQLHAQLQYTIGKLSSYTANKNLIASFNMDYKLTKKLVWNVFLSTNYFKYGDELTPPVLLNGANYLESVYRTGLLYKL